MTGVALDPFEAHAPTGDGAVDGLHEVDVEDRLAVLLPPPLALPPRHPLGDRVDDVLGVAHDGQLVLQASGLLEEVEHRLELTHVVRAVRPAACGPAGVVDEPGPPGGAGVAQGGTVCCGNQHLS